MAKIVTPPHIQDLDDLLELMVRPERGIQYLQDLRDMRDSIVAHLGTMALKNTIEAMQASAESRLAEAAKAMDLVKQEEANAMGRAKKMLADAQATVEAQTKAMNDREQKLDQEQAELSALRTQLAAEQAALNDQAKALRIASAEISKRKTDLEVREKRLEKFKSAVTDAGL